MSGHRQIAERARAPFGFIGVVATDGSGRYTITHNRGRSPSGAVVTAAQSGVNPGYWLDNPDGNSTRFLASSHPSTFITVSVVLVF